MVGNQGRGAIRALVASLNALDRAEFEARYRQALAQGAAPHALLTPVFDALGKAWDEGQISLAQLYLAGRWTEGLLDELPPVEAPARVGLCVLEDHHKLGARLVEQALRGAGLAVHPMGVVTVDEAVEQVLSHRLQVLLVSALMLRAALRVRALRDALEHRAPGVSLFVGGAPFRSDPRLVGEVGADGTADTAPGAVALVQRALAHGRAPR